MTKEEFNAIMNNCTGTDVYYKNPLMNLQYTDGVKIFAENAGAYWFITDVALFAKEAVKANSEEYMFSIHLIVKDDNADMKFKDGDGHICYERHYAFTDCPEGEWIFFYFPEEKLLIWHGEY